MVLSGGGGGGSGGDHQCCYREQLAFNIYSKFWEPKLYRLATKGDWDLIPARCKSHPKEATFRHKYAPNDTALHRILRLAADGLCTTEETAVQVEAETSSSSSSPPSHSLSSPHHQDIVTMKFNAIQAIVQAHPSAASIPDAFGRTPLHLACMDICSASDTAVLQLLLMVPTTGSAASSLKAASAAWLLLQDVEKRTPLHYLLARSNSRISLDALQVLLQACPEAALVHDVVKETPPDIVTRRGKDGEIENVEQVLAMLLQYRTT